MTTKSEEAALLAPTQEITGTVGEDVKTVHKLVDGKPKCGAAGKVDHWQRAVSCADCLD
ncbi:hypothetical protein SEA_EURATIS_55 [Streptomyces phage Euratis]|uniref:Uncharacterized protein n=1 Tax=Streptomyces phage Euratis TaxID=2510569 RepID=A0A411B134_9CAUD|nr:hypothetical protein SEA_EURATIS_55 [Streptomyces phage Euratis]